MSTRDEYVELIKSVALSTAKKATIELILKKLPVSLTTGLAGFFVNPLISWLVGEALEVAIRQTELGAFFLYIDLRTSIQGRDFEKAVRKNIETIKNGTPEQKAASEKELIDRARAFFKLTF